MTHELIVYFKPDCPFCARLRTDLDEAGVAHVVIDVETDDTAAALVAELNGGNRIVPTVVFGDGSALTNPPVAMVISKLGALAAGD
ncbi:glutaredoxin domain-containing protein [Nocardia sp. NPDC024068]|uniref:glutaredoxin domain-containing protein n=1 Tax=Nocardia sp. NPDC024068 TaxID=3157197 RepID=UPI00340B20C0